MGSPGEPSRHHATCANSSSPPPGERRRAVALLGGISDALVLLSPRSHRRICVPRGFSARTSRFPSPTWRGNEQQETDTTRHRRRCFACLRSFSGPSHFPSRSGPYCAHLEWSVLDTAANRPCRCRSALGPAEEPQHPRAPVPQRQRSREPTTGRRWWSRFRWWPR